MPNLPIAYSPYEIHACPYRSNPDLPRVAHAHSLPPMGDLYR